MVISTEKLEELFNNYYKDTVEKRVEEELDIDPFSSINQLTGYGKDQIYTDVTTYESNTGKSLGGIRTLTQRDRFEVHLKDVAKQTKQSKTEQRIRRSIYEMKTGRIAGFTLPSKIRNPFNIPDNFSNIQTMNKAESLETWLDENI